MSVALGVFKRRGSGMMFGSLPTVGGEHVMNGQVRLPHPSREEQNELRG